MAFDPKELKKLAKACREAGIKSYKADGIEFVLSDEAPAPSAYKQRKAKTSSEASNSPATEEIDTDGWDTLSDEQKLFYSSRDPLFEGEDKKQ
jgi:hypothetical protein